MSRILGKLTGTPDEPRPNNNPPAMTPMPSNVPATPTTVMQAYGTQGSTARSSCRSCSKSIETPRPSSKRNPVEIFTNGTGGTQFSFYRHNGLEDAIQRIGEQLHSEYLLSYNPNNKLEAGWHTITVEVSGHGKVEAKTRPGYWTAADFR